MKIAVIPARGGSKRIPRKNKRAAAEVCMLIFYLIVLLIGLHSASFFFPIDFSPVAKSSLFSVIA